MAHCTAKKNATARARAKKNAASEKFYDLIVVNVWPLFVFFLFKILIELEKNQSKQISDQKTKQDTDHSVLQPQTDVGLDRALTRTCGVKLG